MYIKENNTWRCRGSKKEFTADSHSDYAVSIGFTDILYYMLRAVPQNTFLPDTGFRFIVSDTVKFLKDRENKIFFVGSNDTYMSTKYLLQSHIRANIDFVLRMSSVLFVYEITWEKDCVRFKEITIKEGKQKALKMSVVS